MRWVSLRSRSERGATAIVVAMLLVGLLGFTAIAVDVGAAWSTKKQLQTGAEARALAIAQACAAGNCGATAGTADSFADGNRVGGVATGSVVSLSMANGRVTTRAEVTQDFWFAPVLGLDSGLIGAEATAGWGTPSGGTTIPITFSLCEFYWQTGTIVGSPPSTTDEFTITLMTKTPPTPDFAVLGACGTQAAHNEAAGGFGWLDPDPGVCRATSHGGWVDGDTGLSMPCSIGVPTDPVLIPIFNATNGRNGANAEFKLYSYAMFKLTGYCFKNQSDGKWNVGNDNCNKKYLKGYFVKFVSLEDADFSTSLPDLGARVVRLLA